MVEVRHRMKKVHESLFRTKELSKDKTGILDTKLRRCLTTFDISLIGISSTLGSGVYILTGEVSENITGPSIIISITLAAIASILSGLCYTEFAARVPKAGSAYVYSYVVIGEFFAFVVGWNLVLEYGIGAAAVVKGFTKYTDALFNNQIENYTASVIGHFHVFGQDIYPDIFSLIVCILITVLVAFSVKISAHFNSLCTVATILVIVMVVTMGSFYAKVENIRNFFPFGVKGMIAGASSCYYAFIGFDAVCMVSEEAKRPNKSVPASVIITILTCYVGFVASSLVLNMMIPYHEMQGSASLATAFEKVNLPAAKYIIGIGAIFGLLGNAISSMMMMPRFLYSMAQDGLIFTIFSIVNEKTNIPLYATFLGGLLTGIMALFFSLSELVDMVSIGTIMAYTIVTVSVLTLRYQEACLGMADESHEECNVYPNTVINTDLLLNKSLVGENENEKDPLIKKEKTSRWKTFIIKNNDFLNYGSSEPSMVTETRAKIFVFLLVIEIFIFSQLLHFLISKAFQHETVAILFFTIFGILIAATTTALSTFPENSQKLFFKVPLLPWIPVLGLFLNIYLLLGLNSATWIRFGIWMAVGLTVYFTYGFWNSKLRQPNLVVQSLDNENLQSD
ncbi:high affinity cationic amino acid transporter 1 isoform X1 [Hydra vulgaris]|uniref:high affinity cationic amino acid transporter 1 isoform X1 n=1 Tax=Hydra vulgaris TaxID=6087 RepID=UPI00019246A1